MGVSILAVLPVIDTALAIPCLNSMLMPNSAFGIPEEDILVIDNTKDGMWMPNRMSMSVRVHRDKDGHNLGVARSWNIGAREVLERNLDYLLIVSTSMMFGPAMHTTWREQMETFWGSDLIECDGHSWHLVAIHRSVFERVGLFDENFYPGYFEAIDFAQRMRMVGNVDWPRAWVNAMSVATGAALDIISCPAGPLLDYYKLKWGGEKGQETYVRPFGDKPLDYFPERSIPELAKEYGLETWW